MPTVWRTPWIIWLHCVPHVAGRPERIAAGVGFSERLYSIYHQLLESAAELVNDCRCRDGCPACVGPPGEIGPETKVVTRQLLEMVLGE